jgi:ATP-binding cassette, subfamily B, bacterial
VDSKAFAQARRYLYYSRGTTGAAIVASFALALAFVAFLTVAFLLLELVVYQGRLFDKPEARKELERWCQREQLDETARNDLLKTYEQGYGIGLVSLSVRHQGTWYADLAGPVAANWEWTRKNHSYLAGLICMFLATGMVHIFLALGLHSAAIRAVTEAAHRLRRAVYLHTLRVGKLSLAGSAGAPPVPSFTRELETLQEGLYVWLTTTFKEPLKFLLVLTFALALDSGSGWPWLSVFGLVFTLLLWLVGGYIAQSARRLDRRHALAAAEQTALLQESLHMMRLVVGYGMEAFNGTRVERQLSEYHTHTRARLASRALMRQLLLLLVLVAAALVCYAVGWGLLNGHLRLSQTLIVGFALVSLYRPLRQLMDRQRVLAAAEQAAKPVFKFLAAEADVRQVVGAEFLAPMTRDLVFQNVTVRDGSSDEPLLNKVSFTILAGERVALVGESEREKLAIAYLIPRFLDPTEGEVRIDGRKLPWVTLESVRNQVAMVLQDDLVFTDTVRNNIGVGDTNSSLPRIIEAAKTAHAHQFIQKLPQGYDTVIGEMGHVLTLSEKYRIALARAILHDPTILILEEPTDSLPNDVKALLEDTMTRFLPNRTVVFLAHRMATIRQAHRILYLHKGNLEAQGDHDTLLQSVDRYRHVIYLEFNVFADES